MQRRTDAFMTLGQLLAHSGLARASLLHYEKLGLLLPRSRSAAGYRLYGAAELERLQSIRRLRDAGLSLDEIGQLLGKPAAPGSGHATAAAALLQARLAALQQEQELLRRQQRHLARLLASPELIAGTALGSKAAWVALLRRAGFDAAQMQRWHAEFEADDPAAHAAFLRALELPAAEVAAIRRAARAAPPAAP